MIVVDASTILEILIRSETGLQLEEALLSREMHAPHVIDFEVIQTLRRWLLADRIAADDADRALDSFLKFNIIRHSHTAFLKKVWSYRNNLTAYDAAYLSLAVVLGAELVTMDEGLRKMAARR